MIWILLKNYYYEEEMLHLLKTWKAVAVRNSEYKELVEAKRKLDEIQKIIRQKTLNNNTYTICMATQN